MPAQVVAPLPRRAFLGAALAPDVEAFSDEGVLVLSVVAGGMAASAGVQGGDRITGLGGHPMNSLRAMRFALREAGRADSTRLDVLRGAEQLSCQIAVQPSPLEFAEGQEIFYEEVVRDDARLRSIVAKPSAGMPRGVILMLQGIACESVDYGSQSEEPMARLLAGWTDAGFVTIRVDKRGVGDSEGACCSTGDFETELADHRAALDLLASDPRWDGLDIYLFGHSIGGMVAPILASERSVAGLMVYGTSTKSWLDCVTASTRRQLEMRAIPPAEVEKTIDSLRARVAKDGLNGRGAAYHRQLDQLELAAYWEQIGRAKVLVLCGEYDWVLSRDEQLEIGSLVPGAQCIDLAGLDHMLGWHAKRADSLSAYGQGVFREEILERSLEWLGQCGLHSEA